MSDAQTNDVKNRSEEDRLLINIDILVELIMEGIKLMGNEQEFSANIQQLQLFKNITKMMPTKTIIDNFIKHSHLECWDLIKTKNESFFIENAKNVFKSVPAPTIEILKKMFTETDKYGNQIMDQNYRDNIWKVLHNMIKISLKYIHRERKLKFETAKTYYNFFNDVDLLYHSQEWNNVEISNHIIQLN